MAAHVRDSTHGQRAHASVALGVLALVALVGGMFVVQAISDGDRWYVPGAAIGLAAVGLGWTARTRSAAGAPGRRLATVGMVLGAVPFVTLCVLAMDGVVDGMT